MMTVSPWRRWSDGRLVSWRIANCQRCGRFLPKRLGEPKYCGSCSKIVHREQDRAIHRKRLANPEGRARVNAIWREGYWRRRLALLSSIGERLVFGGCNCSGSMVFDGE